MLHITQDSEHDFWLGSGASLYRWEPGAPARAVEEYRGTWIDSLSLDTGGALWVLAWRTGVSRLSDGIWQRFTLPGNRKGDKLVTLLCGRYASGVWVANSDGLSRFDGDNWSLHSRLPEVTLLRAECQLIESSDGSLWINSGSPAWHRGWLADDRSPASPFRTIRYSANRQPPDTRFVTAPASMLESGNAVVEWQGLDAWSRTRAGDLQFSFRVDSGPWSPFQPDARTVVSSLEPGAHRIEVRARDLDGNIDPSPAVAEFTVAALLWKRPWFIASVLAAFLTIVMLAALLVRMRVRHLIAMEEFKIDFFTNISHELRTPLAAIIGPAESLLNKPAAEPFRDSLAMMHRNARRMLGLVNHLLEFRRVELGMLRYDPVRADLNLFLKDIVHAHLNLWQAKRQNVRVELPAEHEIRCFDPSMLQQIVSNLLSNAIKYTPEGGEIAVIAAVLEDDTTDPKAPARAWLRLAVEDNGPGIAAQHQKMIFKPFFRQPDHERSHPGTGIGLAYVSRLVALWGGEIAVESPLSRASGATSGARFIVRLPLTEGDSAPAVISNIVPQTHATENLEDETETDLAESPERPPTVLVVEDNADYRRFLEDELSAELCVVTAEDGNKALEAVRTSPPDLVVTDLMMPDMDGFALCSALKSAPATSHIPVLVLTARGSDDFRLKGIQHGADEYFAKPANIALLQARIRNLLESRRALRERFTRQIVIQPEEITVTPLDEQFLRKAISIVEAHMRDEDFDVPAFSMKMGMGRASLYRKMTAVVGQSPFKFIRSIRLKRAVQLLESGNYNVSETMELTGINGLSYFGRIFREEYGVSPSEYRARVLATRKEAAGR